MRELFMLSICVLLLFGLQSVSAQDRVASYTIVDDAGIPDLSPYHTALQKANLSSYRYLDARRVLNFENGLKVELLSVNELQNLGLPVDATARQAAAAPKREAVFEVKGGFLLEKVRPVRKGGH